MSDLIEERHIDNFDVVERPWHFSNIETEGEVVLVEK
jgi:hypothetical protein